jgi:tetratricopeptide (TPR) repeat protein
VVNKELSIIEMELEEHYRANNLNGLNCYLIGVIYKERNKITEAKEAFTKALLQMPMLWSAWLELGSILKQGDKGLIDGLCNHWMKNFYFSSFYLEIHQEKVSIELNAALFRYFPESVYLKN